MGVAAVAMVVFLVVVTTAAYFYLLIYHPEWVGITGNSARKTLEEHKEGSTVDDKDFL